MRARRFDLPRPWSLNAHFAMLLMLLVSGASASEPCDHLTDTAIGAALGQPDDVYNLAVDFYTGNCVYQDYKNAALLWEKVVAATGDLSAKNNLGYLLSEGMGVAKDEARAQELWADAAVQGHAEAQFHLGIALFNGYGVPRDQARGLAWVLSAIEAAVNLPGVGGGPEVEATARAEKARMLKAAPGLEASARELIGSLGIRRK